MKIAYKHLINLIPSKPGIEDISEKLFQLGHEHEIENNIFNMDLTPNRGDCLSLRGLLRELAVFYEVNLDIDIYKDELKLLNLDFINKEPLACPHIAFLKIDFKGEISSYKGLLKGYFNDLGINKNNFFTDISNYLSYEIGQPTHCYDSNKLRGKLSLEFNEQQQEFETLLGTKIDLRDKNLVFLNDNNVINLAGVMGNKNTSCSTKTKSAIIECAYFKPDKIIGKSVKYDIKSDAAYKFERGVDPLCHEFVLRRFISIAKEHVNIVNLELFKQDYQEYKFVKLPLNVDKINKILGIKISKKDYLNYILKLGFIADNDHIEIPSYRGDIKTENDIAEEIARVIGYNNIPASSLKIPTKKNILDLNVNEKRIKNLLNEHGFHEVINNPFVNTKFGNSIKVDNPLDSNKKYIRTSLESSLIDNLLYNERRQQDSIKLFEISDIYYCSNSKNIENKRMLGIICSGRVEKNYQNFSKKIDKNYLVNVLKNLFIDTNFDPILINRHELATKLKSDIVFIEIELNSLKNENFLPFKHTYNKLSDYKFIKYVPISEYPYSYRDLSFSVKDKSKYNELQNLLLNFKDELLKEVFIFDFFVNTKSAEIKIGFRFIFQSRKTTIIDKDVNKVMNKIIRSSMNIDSIEIPGLHV